MTAVVLGVAGGTGSGKTTVAQAILGSVGADRIAFLEQDAYYADVVWRDAEEIRRHNFDHPDSLDTALMIEHLVALKAGRPAEVPIYDFVNHRRRPETRRVEPRPVVVVEGILLFVELELRELLDFKVFVDTPPDIRLIRRLRRDIRDRGRDPHDVLRQYEEQVRPMHEEFVEPSKRYADIIVPEGGENRVALDMLVARVEQLLAVASA
ncbi:MAG TPA: uridine kinase [Thermoanaerobaculia bacterium]|nr:uridine kinase [Thermoanaerobaculia bacterium]